MSSIIENKIMVINKDTSLESPSLLSEWVGTSEVRASLIKEPWTE